MRTINDIDRELNALDSIGPRKAMKYQSEITAAMKVWDDSDNVMRWLQKLETRLTALRNSK